MGTKRNRQPTGKAPGPVRGNWPAPGSLGHQKLQGVAAGITLAALGRAVDCDPQVVGGWLRDNSKPARPAQDRLRGLYGIQWGDWDRRPLAPDATAAELLEEGLGLPVVPDALPVGLPPPDVSDDDLAGLASTLERTLAAADEATGSALAALLGNERAIRVKMAELRDQRRTERERLITCPMLQGWYRVAVAVLRPAFGDDWPALAERISRAWDAVDEDGKTPEGFEP